MNNNDNEMTFFEASRPLILMSLAALAYQMEYALNFIFVTMVDPVTFAVADIVRRLAVILTGVHLPLPYLPHTFSLLAPSLYIILLRFIIIIIIIIMCDRSPRVLEASHKFKHRLNHHCHVRSVLAYSFAQQQQPHSQYLLRVNPQSKTMYCKKAMLVVSRWSNGEGIRLVGWLVS
jgi:hypothetical protein